jgi:hypothetical protein
MKDKRTGHRVEGTATTSCSVPSETFGPKDRGCASRFLGDRPHQRFRVGIDPGNLGHWLDAFDGNRKRAGPATDVQNSFTWLRGEGAKHDAPPTFFAGEESDRKII